MRMRILLLLIVLGLSACTTQSDSEHTEATKPVSEHTEVIKSVSKYSAQTFFDTTSFSPASPDGLAYSPDKNSVLLNSDETGVFNAYSVDIASGERKQLTTSTTNAVFGVSFFPNDTRVLFTADNGGDELNHVWVRELLSLIHI